MAMIGSADGEGLDALAHLVEHLAEIEVFFGLGPALGGEIQVFLVDVADRHDVSQAAGVVRIAGPLAAHADARELHLFISRQAFPRRDAPQCPIPRSDSCRRLQEPAAICSATHVNTP
jgi:hypothetical protein